MRCTKTKESRSRGGITASITVEASIALPVFLFFFLQLLTAFDILRMQCDITAAMHQVGNRIAVHRFETVYALDVVADVTTALSQGEDEALPEGYGEAGVDGVLEALLNAGTIEYAREEVIRYLGETYLSKSLVSDGSAGLNFAASGLTAGDDIVDLVCTYQVEPVFGLVGFAPFRMENRYFGHAWVGYEGGFSYKPKKDTEEEVVYITETGTVYHRDPECTHIKLSITAVEKNAVASLRNEGGGKYHTCEVCGGIPADGTTVYITNYGDRYHGSLGCSGLKRTVTAIKLSEVGSRRPCSRCGQ